MKSHSPSFSVQMVKNSKPVGKVFRKSNRNKECDKSVELNLIKKGNKVWNKLSLNGMKMKPEREISYENKSQTQKLQHSSLSKRDLGNTDKRNKSHKRKINEVPDSSDSYSKIARTTEKDNNSGMGNTVALINNESKEKKISGIKPKKHRKKKKKKKLSDGTTKTYKPVLIVKEAKDISSNWKNLKDIIAQQDKVQAAELKENIKKCENQKHSHNKEIKMKKKEKLKLHEMIEEQKRQTEKYTEGKKNNLAQNGKQNHENKTKESKGKKMDDIWFDNVDPILLGEEYNEEENEAKEVADKQEEERNSEELDEGDGKAVAIDCEMVGIGINGKESMLARVSVVNQYCRVIYDKYVKPQEPVVDYRTEFSGIRPEDIKDGHDFKEVQAAVAKLLNGKILVGHGVDNDLRALFLQHPRSRIRDTARYKPFKKMFRGHTPKLKMLSQKILGVEIQSGEHDSVQDAQAVMRIYTVHKKEWDKMKKKIYQRPNKKSTKKAKSE